jgi:hypothetical protein
MFLWLEYYGTWPRSFILFIEAPQKQSAKEYEVYLSTSICVYIMAVKCEMRRGLSPRLIYLHYAYLSLRYKRYPSSGIVALRSIRGITEVSTRNLPGGCQTYPM